MVQVPGKQPENSHKAHRILIVCHGNICRSPLAESVLTKALGKEDVCSRGLKAKDGRVAAKKVRDWAWEHGLDLTEHRSSLLRTEDIESASIILYMDDSNKEKLLTLFPQSESKLCCLAEYAGLSKLRDPNFLSRGPELDKALEDVVTATTNYLKKCL